MNQEKSREYAINLRVNIAETRKTVMVSSIGRVVMYSKEIIWKIPGKVMVKCIG